MLGGMGMPGLFGQNGANNNPIPPVNNPQQNSQNNPNQYQPNLNNIQSPLMGLGNNPFLANMWNQQRNNTQSQSPQQPKSI